MKFLVIIYLLLIHVFVGIAIVKTDIVSRFQAKLGYVATEKELTPIYHTLLAFHKRIDENVPNKSIIFIGDSITQGLSVTAISPNAINYGIGQDTTIGVLNRIPFYRSILDSNMVVVAIGLNDLKRRENSKIIANYLAIIDLIPNHIPVLFSAIIPIDEVAASRAGTNERIKILNKNLSNICNKSQRLHLLNISEFVTDSYGNLSTNYHIGDGVHLSGLGNKIWIERLRETIQAITNNNQG